MKFQLFNCLRRHNIRVFFASLLVFCLVTMPMVPLAAATRAGESRLKPAHSAVEPEANNRASESNAAVDPPDPLLPGPVPVPLAPSIVATMDDGLAAATTVAPGGTINYSVNIRNNGVTSPADDALNVLFTNQIDAHTTLVPGSSVAAVSDRYNTIGNVQISVPDGTTDLLGNDFDPDTGNNTGMTALAETKSSAQCAGCNNVTINANGSFTYNPAVGFSGTDTFTYTAQSGTSTATETVTITVANEIWFINNASSCVSNCNGRLSNPFTSLAAFTAANLGGAGQPGDNDWIFIYESGTLYTGPATLRLGQKFIGQDATASLITLTGFTQPSGTDPLPAMNSANATIVNITGANVNGINLNSGNTLRGFTVGSVGTGTKISGTNFGTLLVGNSASPDVTLTGTGQALSLTTGTLSVAGRFVSVTTTSSAAQGISLAGVADSDGAGVGSFSFGSTAVSGSTTQGILIGTTTADLNLGNVSVTNGTAGISFQNNSAGTRTIGTLNVTGGSTNAFLHGAAGGNVTVTGAATLSSANSAVSVSGPGATNAINFQAATSATSTGAGNTALTWTGVAGASITFNSLTIQRNNGTALNATGGGTVTVTNNTGLINNTTPAGAAIVANGVALNTNFSAINSTGGTNAVSLTNVSGTSGWNGGSLTGTAAGATFLVSGGTTSVTYSGGITQGTNAPMVSIGGGHATGTITFQTGTLSATNGTGLQFDNADGTYSFNGTTTLNGGDAGIDILNGSGGTFTFTTGTTITNPSGTGFNHNGSTAGVTYSGNITKSTNPSGGLLVDVTNQASGTITFQTGTLSSTGNSGTGIQLSNADGTVNFNGTNTLNGGDAAIDIITGCAGTFAFSTNTALTNPSGIAYNEDTSTANVTYNGTITKNNSANNAVNINAKTGGTTAFNKATGGQITASTTTANAIDLTNTGGIVNFTGGLSLTTTSGVGFNATGSGTTVNATQNNTTIVNTISSTIGTALNVANTTIGASGLTFRSISANGAVSGIILNTTGSGGGLTVTGNGGTCTSAATCTGGAIQNATGHGISLTSTNNLSLDRMMIQDSANDGINGTTVTNFSFTNSTMTGAGNGANEFGIFITNLFGTNTINNSSVTGSETQNLRILNTSATAGTLTISNSTFSTTSVANGSDAVNISADTSGNLTVNLTDNNDLNNTQGDGIQATANQNGTLRVTVDGSNSNYNGNLGSAVNIAASGNAQLFALVRDFVNVSTGTSGTNGLNVINIQNFDTSTINATVLNNSITALPGGPQNASGIRLIQEGNGNITAKLEDNTITGVAANGIIGQARAGTGQLNLTIDNNSINLTSVAALDGISITSGSSGGGDSNTVRLDMFDCDSASTPASQQGYRLVVLSGTTFALEDLTGSGSSEPNITNWVNNVKINSGLTNIVIGGTFTSIADVPEPTLPLFSASGGVEATQPGSMSVLTQAELDTHVTAAIERWSDIGLTAKQIATMRSVKFEIADLPGEYLAEVSGNLIRIDRDAGNYGWFVDSTPMDDVEFGNSVSGVRRYTDPAGAPAGRMDLVTAIMHEMGHRVGLYDSYSLATRDDLMYGYLTKGERRLPSIYQALFAIPDLQANHGFLLAMEASSSDVCNNTQSQNGALFIANAVKQPAQKQTENPEVRNQKTEVRSHHTKRSVPPRGSGWVPAAEDSLEKAESGRNHSATSRAITAPMSGETVTANIGTLTAGSSVTITYQVTVNNPPNLTLLNPPRVSNQGTVTATGGINVLTDDTTVVGASNPTVTLIDLFNTTTTLASNLNPSNFGDQVTLTATVAENPTQASADPTGTVDFIDTSNGNAVICNDVPVAAGSAQCQTTTLTASTHNIRADYSGDGNFDPSQSNVVAQVVNACTPNPIVTSTADSGAGTLREAITSVCSGTTITFNIAGPGPHTITLTTGEIAVTKNVTVNNNSGESVTVSGNNVGRVFNINSGKTAALIGLTLTGGNSAAGGGAIINDGSLTIVNSTLSGNTAATDGGAISTTATGTALTLINTTISGNNANGSGGGVIVLGGTVTSVNSTFTNNRADNDNNATGTGGGLAADSGTTTLKNTIVAGNFNEDGASDAADDISGTVDAASSFNLIGTGGAGGLTNGVNNNQVGVASPGLGLLANNGGLTFTHALLPTSPAVETGSNANLPLDTFDLDGDANTAETLPVDQRGTGFPRTADSSDVDAIQTVDIGAFELHPSVEDIGNQTTNEDTIKNVTLNLGDDTGSLIATVTATSSNTTLVPNLPANLSFTGSGGSRTLQITPAANQSGTTTITVTVTATNGRTATDTFDLTVGSANDPPSGTDNAVSTNEDTAYTFAAVDFGFTDPNDTPPNTLVAVRITTLPALGTLTNNNVAVNAGDSIPVADISGGLLKFTPVANGFGTPYTSFTFQVQDNGGGGTDLDPTPNVMTINVTAVNDPPSFTIAGNPPSVNQDAGAQTVLNFATSISQGPNETGQILNFNLSPNGTTGTLTFLTAPSINSTTGTLTYTANNGTSGTATFDVTLSDNGSNVLPNSNTSATQSFTITVIPPNATPVVTTTAGNLAYTENDPATLIDPGLTVTDSDNADLVGATVAITAGFVSAQDTLFFTAQLGITGNYDIGTGVLTLTGTTTLANYQTVLRTVTYQNSSDNPTASRTITFNANDSFTIGSATRGIAITASNDGPVNTVPGGQTTAEDTAKVFSSGTGNQISVADADLGANPIKITLTGTNGTITLSTVVGLSFTTGDGTDATMVFTGTLTNVNTALNGLSFNPTPNFDGAASLQIVSDDQGFTGTGGTLTDTDSVNITVTATDDPPVLTTTAGSLAYTENDLATAIDTGLTVTDSDSANLTGATVAITAGFVSAQDTLAFTNTATITGNYDIGTGVLTLSGSDTVANYQTALRSVTYQNGSDNPTASRTVTFTANDGTSTGSAMRGITIAAVNDPPVNTMPGPQGTNQNTPLIFSSGNGNQISIADPDAGSNNVQVTLTVTNGTLTLNGISGLSFIFSDGNGTGAGDGTADATMTFRGSITDINNALNGMTFTPSPGFTGPVTLTVTTNDLGNAGSGGPQTDSDIVNIQVAMNISIQDAQVAEPASGSVNMIFTVTLSAPAPASGVSVNFTTQEEPPAINHATAGQDYTTTSGTVNFAPGEQIRTITVPVLTDANVESNETFLVVLSSPMNGQLADGTATGTILNTDQPGTVLISELRTSGPGGAGDDFVEIYNNTNSPITIAASDASAGYGLYKMGADCNATPALIGVIPNGTIIPARGHYLFVGSAYSLANYGGTGAAAGDPSLAADIESDRNVALFTTSSVTNISTANRLDAVGFGANTGGVCDLLREGTTLTPLVGSVLEYSYVRDECGKKGNPTLFGACPTGGFVKDSNVNGDDLVFVETTGAITVAGQRLGAPGPQNLASSRLRNSSIPALLIDSNLAAGLAPNRVRDLTPAPPNGMNGTLSIRRRFVNNTGVAVTRLRFRIIDISSLPGPGAVADVRALNSIAIAVNGVNDAATCLASNGVATTPCNITVQGTTVETPPGQPMGGALNSSMSAGTITLATPLAAGASLNLQFLLGVQQPGLFKFVINIEALAPGAVPSAPATTTTPATKTTITKSKNP